jgi:hypothetical protein
VDFAIILIHQARQVVGLLFSIQDAEDPVRAAADNYAAQFRSPPVIQTAQFLDKYSANHFAFSSNGPSSRPKFLRRAG